MLFLINRWKLQTKRNIVQKLYKSTSGANYANEEPPCAEATMDDLPQPEGCWYTEHKKYQRRYNFILLMAIGFFSAAAITAKNIIPFNVGPSEAVRNLSKDDFDL